MLFLLVPATAGAEIYKYVDENGVMMLTDTPKGGVAEIIDRTPAKTGGTAKNHNVHQIIISKADKYKMDPALINAVIRTESAYDSRAVSNKGAMGLMQLMPGTAKDMGVKNPFNPEENIEGGTRYLRRLIDKYDGDVTRALAAYNAGPKRVETSSTLPRETTNYIKKVYASYSGERRLSIPKKQETVIYKIVLEDGQVLYTNTPPQKKVSQSL